MGQEIETRKASEIFQRNDASIIVEAARSQLLPNSNKSLQRNQTTSSCNIRIGDMEDMMSAVVQIEKVSKVYETPDKLTLTVLEDIDLPIEKGSFVTLIGPSGCGKSTLVNIIGGLIKPSSGRVTIDGTVVTKPEPSKIAMVFQEA